MTMKATTEVNEKLLSKQEVCQEEICEQHGLAAGPSGLCATCEAEAEIERCEEHGQVDESRHRGSSPSELAASVPCFFEAV